MKKLENFKKSLTNLQEIYDYQEPYSNVIMTGLVGLFESLVKEIEKNWII